MLFTASAHAAKDDCDKAFFADKALHLKSDLTAYFKLTNEVADKSIPSPAELDQVLRDASNPASTAGRFEPDYFQYYLEDFNLKHFINHLLRSGKIYIVPRSSEGIDLQNFVTFDPYGHLLIEQRSLSELNDYNDSLSQILLRAILANAIYGKHRARQLNSDIHPSDMAFSGFRFRVIVPILLRVQVALGNSKVASYFMEHPMPLPDGVGYYPASGRDMEPNSVLAKFFPSIKELFKIDDENRFTEVQRDKDLVQIMKYGDVTSIHPREAMQKDNALVIFKCPGSYGGLMNNPTFVTNTIGNLQQKGVILNFSNWGYYAVPAYLPAKYLGLEKLSYLHDEKGYHIDVFQKKTLIKNEDLQDAVEVDRLIRRTIETIYEGKGKDVQVFENKLVHLTDQSLKQVALALFWQALLEMRQPQSQDSQDLIATSLTWVKEQIQSMDPKPLSPEDLLGWVKLKAPAMDPRASDSTR